MPRFTTVSTAATKEQRALITLENLRLQIPLLQSVADATLGAMIEAATAIIERQCGRILASETLVETFDNDCFSSVLHLSRAPVTAVASVTLDGTALTADDYRVKADNGQVFAIASGRTMPWQSGLVVITYTAGYVAFPADLQRACAELVSASLSSGSRDQALKVEDIPGVGRYEYWVGAIGNTGIPTTVTELLRPYRMKHA